MVGQLRFSTELGVNGDGSPCHAVATDGTSDPTPRRGGSGSGSGRPTVLFCGSCDAVVAWNLSAVWEAVMSDPGPVYCLAHSGRLAQLVVGAGPDVHVFDAGSLVMQSSVLGAAPLTALALEASSPPRLALGAADGVLRFFDLSSLPAASRRPRSRTTPYTTSYPTSTQPPVAVAARRRRCCCPAAPPSWSPPPEPWWWSTRAPTK
eukprot:XP_001700016.1 predicted protein [Chlamydomonas reinhardtii]